MRTITGGISSRGTKVGFPTSMFKIELGRHWMKTRQESTAGPLLPEKHVDRFMEFPRVPYCSNASSESFIQHTMVYQSKFGLLA
jgi:hypothetical protein